MQHERPDGSSILDQLERAFVACHGRAIRGAVLEQARQQAQAVLDEAGDDGAGVEAAALTFASELFASLSVELAARGPALRDLVVQVALALHTPRVVLARQVLCLPQLLQLPSEVATEVELSLLLAFGELRALSLWTLWPGGEVRHIAHVGEFSPQDSPTRALAGRLVRGGAQAADAEGTLAGVLLDRRKATPTALIGHADRPVAAEGIGLLESAASMLSAILEREDLLAREAGDPDAVLEATQRRLTRLRFDLHDGPQQDILLLAEDLGLFGRQLTAVMDGHPQGDRVLGRLEDLQARLVALDGDLRRVSVDLQSPFLPAEPLRDMLAQLTGEFTARTGIKPESRIRGDFSELSDSQQIALLGLVREALSNVREHSGATHVKITLSGTARGIRATVTDDGCGFDPDETLIRAAREGHLGLVSMHERMRLLGGRTQIDSRPGGPTVVSIFIPRNRSPE